MSLKRFFSMEVIFGSLFWALVAAVVGYMIYNADTKFTGNVSGYRVYTSGIHIDMINGATGETMSAWLPTPARIVFLSGHHHLPTVGSEVTVTGKKHSYDGHPEIIINDGAAQIKGDIDVPKSRYQGTISGIRVIGDKHMIDLDGVYPKQKMTVVCPTSNWNVYGGIDSDAGSTMSLFKPGDSITVEGYQDTYASSPQIDIDDLVEGIERTDGTSASASN